jgi:hypothetical protein
MTMLKKNISILAAAICTLAAVTSVAAMATEGGSEPAEAPQVTAIEPEAQDAASVLEEPRVASDAIPDPVADELDEHPTFGMNPGLSRLAIGSASNSVYLLPADGHVCSAVTAGDGAHIGCVETSDLAAGHSGPGLVSQGGVVVIYGLVPDGVESVTVETESGSQSVAVDGNAYLAAVEAGTANGSVSYSGQSGEASFPIYDPTEGASEQ